MPVAELCREHGMSNASFYKWRAKYGGMDASMVSQMKAMEEDNRRLKRMYADLSMQADLLKEALGKKCRGHLSAARWPKRRLKDEEPASRWPAAPLA
jgi:putative transposase